MNKIENRTGLLIVIPTLGRPVTLEWSWAFKSLTPPINYNTNFFQIYGKPVDQARNEAAEEAIKQDVKYLFFIGDDTIIPPHALKQLIFRMEHDPKLAVCGGIYFSKSDPPAPLVFREFGAGSYWDWKVGEYFNINGIGMDCTMIRTDVFKKLQKPWFKTIDSNEFLDGKNKADQWTEDLYFCKKVVEETDYKIFADASIICTHVNPYTGKRYGLIGGSFPTRRLECKKEKKALDIGCGSIDRSEQFQDFDLVRLDIREECNPDYRCDVRLLPFENKEFDLVFSSHVLEHFSRAEYKKVLKEWIRVLKDDGTLILVLPNVMWAAEELIKNNGKFSKDILNVFYGGQINRYDFHFNGFTPQRLELILRKQGFKEFNVNLQGYNIIMEARRNGI